MKTDGCLSQDRRVAEYMATATQCSVSNGLMGGRGWRAPARNPGASFASLSPAPATRSIKARLTEQFKRLLILGVSFWRLAESSSGDEPRSIVRVLFESGLPAMK